MSAATQLQKNELTLQITQLQTKYQALMQQAVQKGDALEIKRLAKELNDAVQTLIAQATMVATVPPKEFSYASKMSDLNLNNFVYFGEKNHFLTMLADPILSQFVEIDTDSTALNHIEGNMAKTALKLDLRFSPSLKTALQRCQEVLKLKAKTNIYVTASPYFNAFCMPANDDELRICVTSSLLEKFNAAELSFVLGHEIGHALFAHTSVACSAVLSSEDPEVTPMHRMRMMAWSRAKEVTADRVGLLCGESFAKSARALFKVSYGFEIQDDEALSTYIASFGQTEKVIIENLEPEDFFSTHPFGPVRLIALDAFSRSQPFADQVGKPKFDLDRAALEKTVTEVISPCDNSYLENPKALETDVAEFLFLSGIAIAASDGEIASSEIEALAGLLHREINQQEVMAMLEKGFESCHQRLAELAHSLHQTISYKDRLTLLRDLCVIAMADGKVMKSEYDQLTAFAEMFKIQARFIDDVFNEMMKK